MAKSIVGIAIAKSNDHVYTWFDDETYTEGDSGNLQQYDTRRAIPYQVPCGSSLEIVAMSINGIDNVYTWYKDGTHSVGTFANLCAVQGRQPMNWRGNWMPGGHQVSDIVGIAIAGSNDHVYVWYKDQTVSAGTSVNFTAYQAPMHYDLVDDPLKPGTKLTPADIVEIDMAKDDRVFTWFRNGIRAFGVPTRLGQYGATTYIQSHVLYASFTRTRKPMKPAQATSVAEPGGIPPTITYCGSQDAMVAVSPNFIGMSESYSLKFTDRNGNALDLGLSGGDCDGFLNATNFFSAFFDPASDVFIDRNVGFTRRCDDPSLPATDNVDASNVDHKFCLTQIYDVRVIFDSFSKHFFVTAQVRNGETAPRTPQDDSAPPGACARFHDPNHKVIWTADPAVCSMPRRQKLLAVSRSEDPRDGFHQYLVTENTVADWPLIAVNGSRVVLSNLTGMLNEPPQWPVKVGVVQVLDLASVAAGKHHPPFFEYFPADLEGITAVAPATHHGNTQGLTYLLASPKRLWIFGMPDHPDPWQAPRLLLTHEFGTSNDPPDPQGAVFRNGTLFLVKGGQVPSGSTVQNGVRVVSIHVHKNGQSLDTSVDLDKTFHPDDASISFDDPSIDVNRNGTIMIGYHAERRNFPLLLSTARAQVWPFGHPSATDLLVTPGGIVQATCTRPCRQKNDYTTTVVDPADDVNFWTALPYTDTVRVRTSITKVAAP